MDHKSDLTILRPDNAIHSGFWKIYQDIFTELTSNAWLISQLIRRDMSVYRQSVLGIYWTMVMPFLSVLVVIVLQKSNIFSIGDIQYPYPIFAVTGLVSWQLFSIGLASTTESLVNSTDLVVKINISRKAIVIASMGRALIGFTIQAVLLIFLFLFYGFRPTLYIFLFPLMAMPIFLLALSLGFVLSLLNCIMRDIAMGLSFLMTVVLLLTPILYVAPATGWISWMTRYNLLYHLIELPRELALTGTASNTGGYSVSVVLTCLIFFTTLKLFHLAEHRITEKI